MLKNSEGPVRKVRANLGTGSWRLSLIISTDCSGIVFLVNEYSIPSTHPNWGLISTFKVIILF